jgi:HEPN domain-containing protein
MGMLCCAPTRRKGREGLASLSRSGSLGHVVAKLLRELPIDVPRELVERGSVLDNFYVPARCPNGHPEGAPFEHYGPRQSKEAIEDARAIFEFVGVEMAKPPRG